MKDTTFTIDQVLKLREIEKARIAVGGLGLRGDLQKLIVSLTSGGVSAKSDDLRLVQAERLWDMFFGEAFDSFNAYLATIPEITEALLVHDERFPLLILVDPRPGLTKMCKLAGLKYTGDDQMAKDFDPKRAKTEKVYWMRCQDGRKNHNKSVKTCRKSFAKDEIGLTAIEGVAFYVQQHPEVIKGHYLDLAGSVLRNGHGLMARLGDGDDAPELYWSKDSIALPGCGSASRRE